ncbi:MAG: 30S ribosomal protein S7 [Patescibacteria group bacterium]
MPRRKYEHHSATADTKYNSIAVSKFINIVMKDGKKTIAQDIVYGALDMLKEKKLDPIAVLDKVIEEVGPKFTVRPRRIGGASYMVPKENTPKHRLFLAIDWVVSAARDRSNKEYHSFQEKLVAELEEAYQGKGEAVNKRVQTEKLAEQNKVFAHFAW